MSISKEMRLLARNWASGQGWPKRLEALEIIGIRGWVGQRIEFKFPIVALVGENGAGKSTILQAAASVYRGPKNKTHFASSFFPDTPWDKVQGAAIKWWIREGQSTREGSVRKETTRWRGNPERRERTVEYVDLSRIQPVSARTGYSRLAKPQHKVGKKTDFDNNQLKRLSEIMGRNYQIASMSTTNFDAKRAVPVATHNGTAYSGFHGGAGEITMLEFLQDNFPKNSLVVIDEIETSLHPRAQRRLMRDLASIARLNELQFIVSTHSPYVLDELPPEARLYIWEGASGREIMHGVSPQFAMTRMDLEQHPDCDVYVEDDSAITLIREVLAHKTKNVLPRCQLIAYGAASVGAALGQMEIKDKFPRPSCIFLDGDQKEAQGCHLLPGGDAPERVVFGALAEKNFDGLAIRVARSHSQLVDFCTRAMTMPDHHDWVQKVADELSTGGAVLWQAMCATWAESCASDDDLNSIVDPIVAKLPND